MRLISFENFSRMSISKLLALLFVFFASGAFSSQDPVVNQKQEKIIEEENTKSAKPECTAPIVEIDQGKLCGVRVKTTSGEWSNAYPGIPFAESAAGKNRWRAPVPDSGWEGTLKATLHGLYRFTTYETNRRGFGIYQ